MEPCHTGTMQWGSNWTSYCDIQEIHDLCSTDQDMLSTLRQALESIRHFTCHSWYYQPSVKMLNQQKTTNAVFDGIKFSFCVIQEAEQNAIYQNQVKLFKIFEMLFITHLVSSLYLSHFWALATCNDKEHLQKPCRIKYLTWNGHLFLKESNNFNGCMSASL
jgi:hypothetical protein